MQVIYAICYIFFLL